jgi:hypothetical protein
MRRAKISYQKRGRADRHPVREFDITERPEYVGKYHLSITPTTLIMVNAEEKIRFERLVTSDELKDAIQRYL